MWFPTLGLGETNKEARVKNFLKGFHFETKLRKDGPYAWCRGIICLKTVDVWLEINEKK